MAQKFDFQLLADGATGGAAVAVPDNSLENNTGGEQTKPSANESGSDAGNQTSANQGQIDPKARAMEFEELIKGDFKAQFEKKVQGILDRRFKAQKSAMEENEAAKPIIDMLAQRYGTSNLQDLKSAIEGDNTYWEAGAEKEGLEVDQYKELMMLRAENQRFRQAQEMTEQQRYMREVIEGWENQAKEVQTVYPDFDLQTELSNKDFQGLLKAGIPVKHAYELMHMEEIQTAIKEKTEKTVMDHIRANGQRPAENGVKNSNGFVLGKDVSAMTKEERAEIAKRSKHEKIVL